MPEKPYQHQSIVSLLEDEAAKRNLSLAELSRRVFDSDSTAGNITRGQIPGLKACIDISRFFSLPIAQVIYMAGHITEEEMQRSLNVLAGFTLEDMQMFRAINAVPDRDKRRQLIGLLNVGLDLMGVDDPTESKPKT